MKAKAQIHAFLLFAREELIRSYRVPAHSKAGENNALKAAKMRGQAMADGGSHGVRVYCSRTDDSGMELVWEARVKA